MLAEHKDTQKNIFLRNQKHKRRTGTASNVITRGLELVCGRPTLTLSSALVPQTLSGSVCVENS